MAELGFKLRQPGTTAPKHVPLLGSPANLQGTEAGNIVVRRLAQGHPAGQRVKGTLAVVWGQGPSAPSSHPPQLPFAVLPILTFTSMPTLMQEFANGW